MADVSTWSATAASNNATPPDGWPENMLPSQVNDTGREMMAAVRRFYDDVIAVAVNGSFYATGAGGAGGYFVDGFQVLSGDNSDILYLGFPTHWVAMIIGSAGMSVAINDTATFRFGQTTVTNLPAPTLPRIGQHMTVINALGPTYGAIVAGGGAVVVDVICDGTNWKCC